MIEVLRLYFAKQEFVLVFCLQYLISAGKSIMSFWPSPAMQESSKQSSKTH